MMKRLGIKRGIILILLGAFLYMGMLYAREIPAMALDGLKAIRPIVLELLATSEYSDLEELKKRIVATSEAFKKYASEYGGSIGLGDDAASPDASSSSALPTVTPMPVPTTTPAIIVAQPQASVLPAPVLGAPAPDESAGTEEIKPEPPAAAFGPSNGEVIQPPAVLAAPVVVPVVPAPGGVAAPTSAVPGMVDIQSMGDLTVPADGSSAQPMLGAPDVTGLMPLADLTVLQPLETTPIAVPTQAMPGAIAPQPLQPAFGAMPTLNPMTPAPLGAPQATMMPGLPGLPVLPPLTYHEFDSVDSLDGEMDQLMAMNIPSLPVLSNIQPLATVSEYDQEVLNMELMSLAMQEVPSIVMDETLDDLNLNDLTLAGLE